MPYFFFDPNHIIHSFRLGFSQIANRKRPDTETTYNAFSVTKTFTALAILQLAQQGKLDINEPVIKYLPNFLYGEEITLKQLLTHTAGIPNPIPLSWIHLHSGHKSFNQNVFFESIFEKNNRIKSNPNDTFAYSNLGYVILGQVIEIVAGDKV